MLGQILATNTNMLNFESVRAKLRLMVKRILRKYKYPPDMQEDAVTLVLQQAKALGEAWS
jgi:type I restriction enzyme R subunit